jgi:hypothetical protein
VECGPPGIRMEELKKTMENLSQGSPCASQDPNQISPEYKSEALLQVSTCLVLEATEIQTTSSEV